MIKLQPPPYETAPGRFFHHDMPHLNHTTSSYFIPTFLPLAMELGRCPRTTARGPLAIDLSRTYGSTLRRHLVHLNTRPVERTWRQQRYGTKRFLLSTDPRGSSTCGGTSSITFSVNKDRYELIMKRLHDRGSSSYLLGPCDAEVGNFLSQLF